MEIPAYLAKQVGEGKVVLVLGAGASYGATHPGNNNKKPPLGRELIKLLADKFLGGGFIDESLATVAELAISETDLRAVQEYLHSVFEPFGPADFHKLLPSFKWHGIASLNYDYVIERAYDKPPLQRLQPIVSNEDRIEDCRQSPNDLLYIKLHGCISRITDSRIPLILTPDQYVNYKQGRSRLFSVLSDWARERTLVFVGTSLQDPDLRAVLLELVQEGVTRPRFYYVSPNVSEPLVRLWESKQITTLSGSFEDFLRQLDTDLPGIARAVPVASAALPVFERFTDASPALSEPTRLFLEHDVTYVHSALASDTADPRLFYRGFNQDWAGIKHNLDCPREAANEILMRMVLEVQVADRPELFVLRAEAGAGKSILLRRLAWSAACDLEALCLFVHGDAVPSPEVLTELADLLDVRLYLFVDDAADCLGSGFKWNF